MVTAVSHNHQLVESPIPTSTSDLPLTGVDTTAIDEAQDQASDILDQTQAMQAANQEVQDYINEQLEKGLPIDENVIAEIFEKYGFGGDNESPETAPDDPTEDVVLTPLNPLVVDWSILV